MHQTVSAEGGLPMQPDIAPKHVIDMPVHHVSISDFAFPKCEIDMHAQVALTAGRDKL